MDCRVGYSSEKHHGIETVEPSPQASGTHEKEICGSLEVFEGDVQILDETRTHLIELKRKAPLPCGCWISSNEGWVHLKHVAGPSLNLGAGSYVQLLGEKSKTEQVVVYQGQVYADVNGVESVFKLGSALGRVKTQRGKMVYLAGYADHSSSQLIVLEDSAIFENRFEDSRNVKVSEGEMSELRFDLSRVIPQNPTPIAVATLKPKLFDLRIDEKIQSKAFNLAMKRQERTLAELGSEGHPKAEKKPERKIASVVSKSGDGDDISPGEKSRLHQLWVQKMVPGVRNAENFLFPGKIKENGDFRPAPQFNAIEKTEKKKLMQELLRVQGD